MDFQVQTHVSTMRAALVLEEYKGNALRNYDDVLHILPTPGTSEDQTIYFVNTTGVFLTAVSSERGRVHGFDEPLNVKIPREFYKKIKQVSINAHSFVELSVDLENRQVRWTINDAKTRDLAFTTPISDEPYPQFQKVIPKLTDDLVDVPASHYPLKMVANSLNINEKGLLVKAGSGCSPSSAMRVMVSQAALDNPNAVDGVEANYFVFNNAFPNFVGLMARFNANTKRALQFEPSVKVLQGLEALSS